MLRLDTVLKSWQNIWPSYEDLLFYAFVVEQVSSYRSGYAYNSELS